MRILSVIFPTYVRLMQIATLFLALTCSPECSDLQEQCRAGNFWFAMQQRSDSVLPAVQAFLVDSLLLGLSPAPAMGENDLFNFANVRDSLLDRVDLSALG